jgi:hypothetical protein
MGEVMHDRTIWKYELAPMGVTSLDMPAGSLVLHVGEQLGVPVLWALVEPSREIERRTVRVYGTGHPITADGLGRYVGTVQMASGLVWHVFGDVETV